MAGIGLFKKVPLLKLNGRLKDNIIRMLVDLGGQFYKRFNVVNNYSSVVMT